MAREESDREDLLREATALVERIELKPLDLLVSENVVVGFRRDGAMSVFFGADPVYQFNAAGELRRAFCAGRLLKAVHGSLVSLRRVRGQNAVELLRHDLTPDEQSLFLSNMMMRLSDLSEQLEMGRFSVVGQVPAGADVLGRVQKWLAAHRSAGIAKAPNVGRAKRGHDGDK
jgi:hypothetical protein